MRWTKIHNKQNIVIQFPLKSEMTVGKKPKLIDGHEGNNDAEKYLTVFDVAEKAVGYSTHDIQIQLKEKS